MPEHHGDNGPIYAMYIVTGVLVLVIIAYFVFMPR
jgi:hypothetical protein